VRNVTVASQPFWLSVLHQCVWLLSQRFAHAGWFFGLLRNVSREGVSLKVIARGDGRSEHAVPASSHSSGRLFDHTHPWHRSNAFL
jgi:hypothetical protein